MLDTKKLTFESKGPFDLINLTEELINIVRNGFIESGIVNIYSHGSTSAVVTLGSEDGLEEDFVEAVKRIVPEGVYKHDEKMDHKNGVAHIRSAILGTGVTLPFTKKRLYMGMFQQVYFVDLDFVTREREVIIQIIGE
ncbi:MAG TPA: secondary thiamine-phosphate synthase enzyme YjbQ [bacterium]|nr:secondary thiamine-phosphate synthase enzyme YjbQ [bacterium]HPN67100.1 secondary thiamine-phosphate synthase enzyme YjbQ [bacterium]